MNIDDTMREYSFGKRDDDSKSTGQEEDYSGKRKTSELGHAF